MTPHKIYGTKFNDIEGQNLAQHLMQENHAQYHIHLHDAQEISKHGEEWLLGAFQYCWNNGSELTFSAKESFIANITQGRLQSLSDYFMCDNKEK